MLREYLNCLKKLHTFDKAEVGKKRLACFLPNSLNLALIIGCLCLTSFLFSLAKNYRILRRFFFPR
jgi:hypothetical protein